jgi:hypothetical protein
MKPEINILHLEDNNADACFIKAALLKEDFNVDISLTENRY